MVVKRYINYNNSSYVGGWNFFLRVIWQWLMADICLLIACNNFGPVSKLTFTLSIVFSLIGCYLLSVTYFQRAFAIKHISKVLSGVLGFLFCPLCFFQFQYDGNINLQILHLCLGVFPFLYLFFKSGNPPGKNLG